MRTVFPLPSSSRSQAATNTGDGDVVHVNFFTVGDTLFGGNETGAGQLVNLLFGDARTMSDFAQGGNDTLFGGNNSSIGEVDNFLEGDAFTMSDSVQGGNDTLTGGNNSGGSFSIVLNALAGDAALMSGTAQGGHNTLLC